VLRNQDLSAEIAPTLAAASELAALPCTQTFATLKTSTTIGRTGGQNVICVGDVMLSGSSTVVLSGGATDTFVVNISGKLKLTDSARIVASGVPPNAIIYDLVGTGQQVVLSSRTQLTLLQRQPRRHAAGRGASGELRPGPRERRDHQRAEHRARRRVQRELSDRSPSVIRPGTATPGPDQICALAGFGDPPA
jgi:hypothetical protein